MVETLQVKARISEVKLQISRKVLRLLMNLVSCCLELPPTGQTVGALNLETKAMQTGRSCKHCG